MENSLRSLTKKSIILSESGASICILNRSVPLRSKNLGTYPLCNYAIRPFVLQFLHMKMKDGIKKYLCNEVFFVYFEIESHEIIHIKHLTS